MSNGHPVHLILHPRAYTLQLLLMRILEVSLQANLREVRDRISKAVREVEARLRGEVDIKLSVLVDMV